MVKINHACCVLDIEEDLVNGASGEDEDFIDDYEDDFDEPAEVNNCFFFYKTSLLCQASL